MVEIQKSDSASGICVVRFSALLGTENGPNGH